MSNIPRHMQINKTPGYEPSKELVSSILALPWGKAKKAVCDGDYLEIGKLFVMVRWKFSLFIRRSKRWQCITVSDTTSGLGQGYLLCLYDDHTREYHPGDWEKALVYRKEA